MDGCYLLITSNLVYNTVASSYCFLPFSLDTTYKDGSLCGQLLFIHSYITTNIQGVKVPRTCCVLVVLPSTALKTQVKRQEEIPKVNP